MNERKLSGVVGCVILLGLLTMSLCLTPGLHVSSQEVNNSALGVRETVLGNPRLDDGRSSFDALRTFYWEEEKTASFVDSMERNNLWSLAHCEPASLEFDMPELSFDGTPHDPIVISSNSDFDTQGWPGDGSPGTPYIIENLAINVTHSDTAISISNTDEHFIVRHCTIQSNSTFAQGIVLSSVVNGVLFNNTCLDSYIGILVTGCDGIEVNQNTISNQSRAAIFFDQSTGGVIVNNTCVLNWDGVYLERSSGNTVEGNLCGGNQWGIGLYWESDYNIVYDNTVVDSGAEGIILNLACSHNTIELNFCESNNLAGIYVNDCWENSIIDNFCWHNGLEIRILNSYDNLVEANYIASSNDWCGVLLESSNFTTIKDNDFYEIEVMICVFESASNVIVGNNCTYYGGAIILDTCTSNLVDNNLCDGLGSEVGVVAYNSVGDVVINNYCINNYYGISLEHSNYTQVESNTCRDGSIGISTLDSHYADIFNNTCIDNGEPASNIHIESSTYCTVSQNNCTTTEGFLEFVVGIHFDSSPYGIITENVITRGIDGIVLEASHHATVTKNLVAFGQGYGIGIFSTNYSAISENEVANYSGWEGWALPSIFAHFNEYTHNTFANSTEGIHLEGVSECTFSENMISHNSGGGIYLADSYDLTLERNNIEFNANYGIDANDCGRNRFSHNSISNSSLGAYIYGQNDTLDHNTIEYTATGIEIDDSTSGCLITNNTFADNTRGVATHFGYVTVTWNIFLDNYESAFVEVNLPQILFDYNYWSDYGGTDGNGDGIGDTPYMTSGFDPEQDLHPLVYIPTPPTWIVEPRDEFLEYGTALNQQVSVSTPAPVAPVVLWWMNGTEYFSVSATGLISSDTFLPLGEYRLDVRVYNVYGVYASGTFVVTIDDTIAPTITSPTDFTYDLGSTGHSINWTASDLGPASYSISLDGTVIRTGVWNASGEVIVVNCDGLALGPHTYTITVTDIGGNSVSDSVTVVVTTIEVPIDPTVLLIIVGSAAGAVVLILAVIMLRRRSGAE
ncbi:MAG: hypothetical protein EAX95_12445 [Candidatus Thorarchaeota archaeon]|nr:hypothetical protein [Candidatus Thorarchaeota archaeon]